MTALNTRPDVWCWAHPEGQDVTQVEAGSGQCVAFVQKAPTRAPDDGCQDAAAVVSWSGAASVLVVADGVGGHRDGALAARLAVESITSRLVVEQPEGLAVQSAVLAGIETANQQLIELRGGAATTILVAVIDGNELRSLHAGDSELLVVGQRGKLKHQTVSHSPVGYGLEAGLIDADDGLNHEDRHLISSCVGMEAMRVEVASAISLAARDTVVLASDGLWDNMHVAEVTEIVRKGPLQFAVRELVTRCQQRMRGEGEVVTGKPDDLSILLYRR
ncbi:MAG: serine/threonine protein phosphatase PrpC [Planctomycetota bacterium]|jgi:serine/threonine protein phosphatase PrpC